MDFQKAIEAVHAFDLFPALISTQFAAVFIYPTLHSPPPTMLTLSNQSRSSIYSADDPLTLIMKPKEPETELERLSRLKSEAEAKQRSDAIDSELRLEREGRRKRAKADVKVVSAALL